MNATTTVDRAPRCGSHRPWSARVLWLACLIAARAGSASGDAVIPETWGTSGTVLAMARAGNTLYVGGYFSSVARNSGSGLPLDARTGEPLPAYSRVAGNIYTAVADGSGGWYIGGDFVAVGGQPRHGLAHILNNGSVGPWAPSVDEAIGYMIQPTVLTLAVDGDRIYVGGAFEKVQGVARRNIAAVDRRTGRLLPWAPEADAWVWALAMSEGIVYAGGLFTEIGGAPRSRIAALDAVIGIATDWDPGADNDVAVLTVGHGVLYVGGYFTRIGGAPRSCIAALDLTTGTAADWAPDATAPYGMYRPSPQVRQIVVEGRLVYVTGYFDRIGGASRQGVAAVDAETGEATAWDPGFTNPQVTSIAVRDRVVYIGGGFTSVGGAERQHLAALDAESAAPLEWDPWVNANVNVIAVSGSSVYAGGDFTLAGRRPQRVCLAAFDATTGALKPWDPAPDGGGITAMVVHGGAVYVAGGFTRIGGQPRSHLAAVDALTGAVLPWDPGTNGAVSTLVVDHGTVFAGGSFTRLGGQPRQFIGAVDTILGAATSWDPVAEYDVNVMKVSGRTMYVGGYFFSIGGQPRRGLAALDLATGVATSWNPDAGSGWVNAIEVSNGIVYAGGAFRSIGGQAREGLAAIDASTGRVTAWDPRPAPWQVIHPKIKCLALSDSLLYVGGDFSAIGARSRVCLASVDTATGVATDWDPGADGYVWTLLASENTVHAGGGFTRMGGLPCASLATFSVPVSNPVDTTGAPWVALAPIEPNPVNSEATLRFALATATLVDLSVFDVQGRRVATLLHADPRARGVHEVPIRTAGWREGFYFCRMDAGGASATRKMLVIR